MMIKMIIKQKTIVKDDWRVLRLSADEAPERVVVPEGRVIVPLPVWRAQRTALQNRAELGVWLASDERAEDLRDDIEKFAVIAVDFPKHTDGRGYSIAFHLRTRLAYRGELRAIGDVLRDQMYFLQRCGFDAFEPRADQNMHEALQALSDFSVNYQAAADDPLPLFRRISRGGCK